MKEAPKDSGSYGDYEEYTTAVCEANGIVRDGETYRVPSSNGRDFYAVKFAGSHDGGHVHTWDCSCPARTTCKHIKLVAEINDHVCAEFGLD